MSEPNPYRSPAAESPPPLRRIVWLNIARAIFHNATIFFLLLVALQAFLGERNPWLIGAALVLLLLISLVRIRPQQAQHDPRPAEWVIFAAGLVAVPILSYLFRPSISMHWYIIAMWCWIFVFCAVRDCLYAGRVLPRGKNPPG